MIREVRQTPITGEKTLYKPKESNYFPSFGIKITNKYLKIHE